MKQMICLLTAFLCFFHSGCREKDAGYTTIPVEEFADLIADPHVQRLDVRTVAEYSSGHIEESLNVNVLDEENFAEMAQAALDKERTVAVYCRSGKRSKTAAKILSESGFKVYELKGGFNAWKEAGKPIQK